MALLATVRDDSGSGPSLPWSLRLAGASGEEVASERYGDSSQGSFVAFWWEDIAPQAGAYVLAATGQADTAREELVLRDVLGLPAAAAAPSPDGMALAWAPVEGARNYACRIYRDTVLLRSTAPSAEPSCSTLGLEAGSYAATVLSFSVDLAALGSNLARAPALPEAFHVSEGHVGFTVGASGSGGWALRAAGGPLSYGTVVPGLVLWLSLRDASGNPPAQSVAVGVVGPGLSPTAPLRVSYPAGASHLLVWSYDVDLRPGDFDVTAQVGTAPVSTRFSVGEPPALPVAQDVQAVARGGGALDVSWSAVPGARSYQVSVWPVDGSTPAASIWTHESALHFPSQTFEVDRAYDVYVAASDMDAVPGAPPSVPTAVRVSENAYQPARFTGR